MATSMYKVFRATAVDLKHVRTAMLDLHQREVPDDETLRAFLIDEICYLVLAITNDGFFVGSLIGYCSRSPDSFMPQFLLYEIDVLAEKRNIGLGKRLIEVFASCARLQTLSRSGSSQTAVIIQRSRCIRQWALFR